MAWMKILIIEVMLSVVLLSCSNDDNKTVSTNKDSVNITAGTAVNNTNNIIGYLSNAKEYSVFVDLLNKSGLNETLNKPGPFTVFAPTNKAFEKLHYDIEKLKENSRELMNFLSNHIVAGALEPDDLSKVKALTTLSGEKIRIIIKGNKMFVNNTLISSGSFTCTNGVVYITDEIFALTTTQ